MAPKKIAATAARKAAAPATKKAAPATKAAAPAAPTTTPTQVNMYAIPNCDTIRKARAWLDGKKIPYTFHDYTVKKTTPSPIDAAKLQQWMDALGWDTVLNVNSITYKQLSASAKAAVKDASTAIPLLLEKPSMIKRPVVEWGNVSVKKGTTTTVGFNAADWEAITGKK